MQPNDSKSASPIVLVGGGTGGHIFPLVAVGEELKAHSQPFIFVGSSKSREEEVVQRLGWRFIAIKAGKWRRYFTLASFAQNIADAFRNIVGIFQSARLMRKERVRLVLSKGGFVALPVVIGARLSGRIVILHESDSVMGLANRIACRFATRVLTAFDPKVFPFADDRFVQVGIPIRKALRMAAGLKTPQKSRPLLLILPGSQGSVAINSYVKVTLRQLLKFADVVHLTGEQDFAVFEELHKSLSETEKKSYRPYAFIDRELPYYFQLADLLVTRASATTTAEAALFKKAVYLIPLPTAASNHQVMNARYLEKADSAVVKEQYQLTPQLFLQDVERLINDPARRQQLGDNLHRYFNEDETLVKILKELNV